MHKKILFCLLLSVFCFLAFSCKQPDKTDGAGNTGVTPGGDEQQSDHCLIYGENAEELFLVNNYYYLDQQETGERVEEINDSVDRLQNKISGLSNTFVYSTTSYGGQMGTEIIIGDTDRDSSVLAKRYLDKKIENEIEKLGTEESENFTVGYCIYVNKGSVAIVWSSQYISALAIDYFTDNYIVNPSLTLKDGYVKTEIFSVLDYLAQRKKDDVSAQWDKLSAALGQYGPGIVSELKKFYALYTDDLVYWIADLYEPDISGDGGSYGGFYGTNSARNTVGYLPDIESTYGYLGFIASSGMCDDVGGRYENAIPEWMKKQIGNWILSLRDPENGYYYHPQWNRAYIEKNGFESRIARDFGSASTLLERFGMLPETAPVSSLSTVPLSNRGSVALAVSKVVPTAMFNQYENLENYKKYLAEKGVEIDAMIKSGTEWAYSFYKFGSDLQPNVPLIQNIPGGVEATVEFFDKYQDPETGMWAKELCYNATNGLHKIADIYNKLGAELKHTDKMLGSTITILKWSPAESPIESSIAIYNIWSNLSYILKNIKANDPSEEQAIYEQHRNTILTNAKELLAVTFEQAIFFRNEDGTFRYFRDRGVEKIEGCPYAVPGVIEGDMWGLGAIGVETVMHALASMGVSDQLRPQLYAEVDRLKFITRLEELSPVIKDEDKNKVEIVLRPTVEKFDDKNCYYDVSWDCTHTAHTGNKTQMATELYFESGVEVVFAKGEAYSNESNATAKLVYDSSVRNSYLHLLTPKRVSPRDRSFSVIAPIQYTKEPDKTNVLVFEGDYKIDSQMPDGSATVTNAFTIQFRAADGNFVQYNSTVSDSVIYLGGVEIAKYDTWFNLRLEYYLDEDVIQVYINDKFRGNLGSATSSSGTDLTPAVLRGESERAQMKYCSVGSNGHPNQGSSISIDNISLYQTKKTFDPDIEVWYPDTPTLESFSGVYKEVETKWNFASESGNVEQSVNLLYFDESGISLTYPTDSRYSNVHGVVAEILSEDENKFLHLLTPARVSAQDRSHSVNIKKQILSTDKSSNVLIFETDLKVDSAFKDGTGCKPNEIRVQINNGSDYVIYNLIENGNLSIGGKKFADYDTWFNLRLEYYYAETENEGIYKSEIQVYVDNEYAGSLSKIYSSSQGTDGKVWILNGNISWVTLQFGTKASSVSIDNTALYAANKEYKEVAPELSVVPEEPTEPDVPVVPDNFEGITGGYKPSVDVTPAPDNSQLPLPDGSVKDNDEIDEDNFGEWVK